MNPSRRHLLAAGLCGAVSLRLPAQAQSRGPAAAPLGQLGLDATQFGLRPGAGEDQSQRLQAALGEAAKRSAPLLLPPGRYRVGKVALPDGARLVGVPEATRLVTADGGPILIARHLGRASLSGLVLDGLDIPSPQRSALLEADAVGAITVADLVFVNAGSVGMTLNRCGGSIGASSFRKMRDAALFSLDSRGLAIEGNAVEDCGNNGIQIWRGEAGDDGSIVRGNRVERIRADAGGDGPNGNGISLYRAGGVVIEGNQLRDCAMTFIRNNSGSGVQMLGNQGRRCGETALYSEFAFEGAIIANNLVEDCAQGANITNLDHGGRLAVFANNIIRNARKAVAPNGKEPVGGLGVHVEAEAAVTGNVIENASETGISLGWSWGMRNLAATGNIVRKAGIGISVSLVPKERNALIANNVIAEARNGAVVGTEYGKPVTGDLTRAPDARAAGVRVENNAVS
ncbi:TIGR03808 family TAT-translocated repetitive protein [Bosea minatitlanensis]|uniref:TIGR03808 family TAT-translocated repetitive protein n=1 Tax=Bosea minatitlanensis TaxID=128782 RepID=A0ABW0F382_9HYPH|nr:TIGR03808 family TAT-translocated repetitive protein [Bosea minatitlanensis]MCT4492882.1 TIGR03808 family TAT-translocated repetitive protein [Bosea minatitlanensis]